MTIELSAALLTRMLTDIERDLSLADDTDSVAAALAAAARRRVPGARYAGVATQRGSKLTTLAATDAVVHRADAIQYRLGSGPCVDALAGDGVVSTSDVRSDSRWLAFGSEVAVSTDVVSIMSLQLRIENGVDAAVALNLYSDEVAAFDSVSEAIGLLVATQGALAIARSTAHEKVDNLLIALKTSREIGMAIGVLMQSLKIDRNEAFDLLRVVSQRTHRKLADIAVEVADTGALPALNTKRPSRRQSN
jgi:hypothetical protein